MTEAEKVQWQQTPAQTYSSAYIVKANSSSCPSQLNSVEQHFVISKRTQGKNPTYTLSAQCSENVFEHTKEKRFAEAEYHSDV